MIQLLRRLQRSTFRCVNAGLIRQRYFASALVWLLSCSLFSEASDTSYVREQINLLCAPAMQGRGYVSNGQENAAGHISKMYRETGLHSFLPDGSYYQPYTFSVNTFPGAVSLRLNNKTLRPGADYLVDAASNGTTLRRQRIETVDLSSVTDTSEWEQLKKKLGIAPSKTYLLTHADTLSARLDIPVRRLGRQLPKGVFLIPQRQKLIWTVAQDTIPATVFYIMDTVMPGKVRRVAGHVENTMLPENPARNVIGFVPGTAVPDSFIVFCAHYDHLGRMGDAVFPGANDNASGTAFMLALAKYYAANPQRYSIAFMAFSGEEAGLLGSEYYVSNPLFPLSAIRFLINIDMMADAAQGVTVVNGTERPEEFSLLQQINERHTYLPDVKSRGKSANSDHHYFTEHGVPAFFLYGNGGPGYYHDIYDVPATLTLRNITNVMKLVQAFVGQLQ